MALNWNNPNCFDVEYINELKNAIRERYYLINQNVAFSEQYKGKYPLYNDYIQVFEKLKTLINQKLYIKQPSITEKQIWYAEVRHQNLKYDNTYQHYYVQFVEEDLNEIKKWIPNRGFLVQSDKGTLEYCFNNFLKQMYKFLCQLYCVKGQLYSIFVYPRKGEQEQSFDRDYYFKWYRSGNDIYSSVKYYDLVVDVPKTCTVKGVLSFLNVYDRSTIKNDYRTDSEPIVPKEISVYNIKWQIVSSFPLYESRSKIQNVKQKDDGFYYLELDCGSVKFRDFSILKDCSIPENIFNYYQFGHTSKLQYHVYSLAGALKTLNPAPGSVPYYDILSVPNQTDIKSRFSHCVYFGKGNFFFLSSGYGGWINIIESGEINKQSIRNYVQKYNSDSPPDNFQGVQWFQEKEDYVFLQCKQKLGNIGYKKFSKECSNSGINFITNGKCKAALEKAVQNSKSVFDVYNKWQSYNIFENEKAQMSDSTKSCGNYRCNLSFYYVDFSKSIEHCKSLRSQPYEYEICVNFRDRFKTYTEL